jgi:hypothetical protein
MFEVVGKPVELWLPLFVTTTVTVSSVCSGSLFQAVHSTEAFQVLPETFVPTVPPHCFLAFLVSIEIEAPSPKFVPVTVPLLVHPSSRSRNSRRRLSAAPS